MDPLVLVIFIAVYVGMMIGRLPWLAMDRTGVALSGAVILLVCGRMTMDQAWSSIDVPTIGLLFGLMLLSAQFRLAGAYGELTHRLAMANVSPAKLLGLLVITAGSLSAILANDIVCLAMTPILIQGCMQRGWKPLPFLLALACAANVGSAATLIGNPQNMLIGQSLQMSFTSYLGQAVLPCAVGLLITWAVIAWQYRGRWLAEVDASQPVIAVERQPFSKWQTLKGMAVLIALMLLFTFSYGQREVMALGAAALILISRKTSTPKLLNLVDWQLLILFIGLFVINEALAASGWLDWFMKNLLDQGIDVHRPGVLFVVTAVLSNVVSNVPAVMLLLPAASPQDGAVLALASTLAGNFILVGSIANIIVVTQASQYGQRISWWDHARTGVPVTLLTLLAAAGWLWMLS